MSEGQSWSAGRNDRKREMVGKKEMTELAGMAAFGSGRASFAGSGFLFGVTYQANAKTINKCRKYIA